MWITLIGLLAKVGIPSWALPIIIGGLVALGIIGYNTWENSQIRKDAVASTEARIERQTMEAMNGIASKAEQARVKRKFCADNGKLYDFGANKCQ